MLEAFKRILDFTYDCEEASHDFLCSRVYKDLETQSNSAVTKSKLSPSERRNKPLFLLAGCDILSS